MLATVIAANAAAIMPAFGSSNYCPECQAAVTGLGQMPVQYSASADAARVNFNLAPLVLAVTNLGTHSVVLASPHADEVRDLTFDDLKFDIEPDDDFEREMLTDEINQLEGTRIRIRGYIRPSFKQSGIDRFIFVRDNQECCFGPGAALYDCILVTMQEGRTIDYTVRPITVEGDFYLREFKGPDDRIWAIFRMRNAVVTTR